MKKLINILTIIVIIILNSCETNTIKSGIKGNINFGEGNCQTDQSFWSYYPYNSYVYFVDTNIKDTSNLPISKLLDFCDSTLAVNGNFKYKLKPGNYYLCIREVPVLYQENLFVVQPNFTTEENFWIYKCL